MNELFETSAFKCLLLQQFAKGRKTSQSSVVNHISGLNILYVVLIPVGLAKIANLGKPRRIPYAIWLMPRSHCKLGHRRSFYCHCGSTNSNRRKTAMVGQQKGNALLLGLFKAMRTIVGRGSGAKHFCVYRKILDALPLELRTTMGP